MRNLDSRYGGQRRCLVPLLAGVGALLAVTSAISAQPCPTGGVLDGTSAYFDSTLSPNTCASPGSTCEQVFFYSEQRFATAVCRSGRWQPESAPSSAAACPEYVFAADEIWNDGTYLPNSCDAASAPLCDHTYFYRLPDGGSGYRTAACVAGAWQAEPAVDSQPFRLQRAQTSSELETFLKEGLKATYSEWSPYVYGPWGGIGGPSGAPPDAADPGALSETNVQEAGVDEEDRVKSDGEYLYILKNFQSVLAPGSVGGTRIRVLEMDTAAPTATPISELEVALGNGQSSRGIYLRNEADQLIVTASSLFLDWYYWYSPLAWIDSTSTVASLDVSDPARLTQGTTIELEGEILSSRRIGDVLYLATRFHPHIEGLEFYQPSDAGSAMNIARIEAASLGDLLPSYRSDSDPEARLLVDPRDCYLPTEGAPVTTADILTLVAIDLDSMQLQSSKCFVGASETLYVSLESIYLASTRYEYGLVPGGDGTPWIDYSQPTVETDLHKFSLDDGAITYRASGVVDGHLGWQIARRPFRLSERGDDLRVITYTDELTEDSSPVAITVLRDTGDDELQLLSRLPNARRPDPIGKPGEELYATRFVGDRAYLVTFLVTDPLYVIDLSSPADPFVAGELEITGYSDYLHPFENGYLLGIGKDAIPDPGGDFRGAWYQGVKVSLYDVSDPERPFEADSVVLGKRGSSSPVLTDHRAFTFLPASEEQRARVAIGTVIHERLPPGTAVQPWTFQDWSYSGLQLFEIDTTAGRILQQGEMPVEQHTPQTGEPPTVLYPLRGDDRSVLAGDSIFYIHGDDVYTAVWSNPAAFEGPN